MLYTHAINGSSDAARFLSPKNPAAAPGIAVSIMETKLQTYLQFNQTYPGFGGFLPWFESDIAEIKPTWDWVNRVPGLDNGYVLVSGWSAVVVLTDGYLLVSFSGLSMVSSRPSRTPATLPTPPLPASGRRGWTTPRPLRRRYAVYLSAFGGIYLILNNRSSTRATVRSAPSPTLATSLCPSTTPTRLTSVRVAAA